MSIESDPDKRNLRRRMRDVLAAFTEGVVLRAALNAQALLREQAVWRDAQAILFYWPHLREIDLSCLMEEGLKLGKTVALPRFISGVGVYEAARVERLAHDCAPGKFGIIEPQMHCAAFPLNQLDLILVPGVCFDVTGHRLGRGQGYYDRLLAQFNGTKCGVAFDEQIIPRVPREAHDVRMNFILTPTRWVVISAERF